MDIVINYWAVFAGAALMFAVGALWYSPIMFGPAWMRGMGFTKENMKGRGVSPLFAMIGNAVTAIITAYVLYHFEALLGIASVRGALVLAFWAWLGLMAPITLHGYFWECKPLRVVLISLAHLLVALCAGAVVLFVI